MELQYNTTEPTVFYSLTVLVVLATVWVIPFSELRQWKAEAIAIELGLKDDVVVAIRVTAERNKALLLLEPHSTG